MRRQSSSDNCSIVMRSRLTKLTRFVWASILVLQSSWWGRESWLLCLICLPGVSWWLSGSSSRCHGVVCSLWLWYFLIILIYYFCTHLIASSERDIPVIGRSELIKTRTRVKTNCLILVIFRNDPLSIPCCTGWMGLSKTVTLFINLMHNWLLKNMV